MALWPLTLFLALHGYREYCARRALPQIHHADFEAKVMHAQPLCSILKNFMAPIAWLELEK